MYAQHVIVPYSRKLSGEKTFANFVNLGPFVKVFSTKRGVTTVGFITHVGVSSEISSPW